MKFVSENWLCYKLLHGIRVWYFMKNKQLLKQIDAFSVAEMERLGKENKVAAYFCRQFPPEILAGLGFHPARILSGAVPSAEREGEKYVRPDACPYCKSILGNMSLKKGILGKASIIAAVATCDMMRRTLDTMRKEFDIPIFTIHAPATISENTRKFFISQMQGLVEEISSFVGENFNSRKALDYFKSRKKIAVKLYRISLSGNVPHSVLSRLIHLFNFSSPIRLDRFLDQVIENIPKQKPKIKILLVGSALCMEDSCVPSFIELSGAGLVNLTCSGINQLEGYLDASASNGRGGTAECIAKFAEIILDAPQCIRSRPNNAVYDRIKSYVSKTGVDGVILKTLKFCDLWNTEKERMREFLGIPFLVLDTDYSGSSDESLKNRIDAFVETLEAPRNIQPQKSTKGTKQTRL